MKRSGGWIGVYPLLYPNHILEVNMNKIEPCEMCGRYDGDHKERWDIKELENNKMNLLLAGILFAQEATHRQIELFMAKYYIGRESYDDIGRDFQISKQSVAKTIDRSCDILTNIINRLSG
jgi:hypothetical protein